MNRLAPTFALLVILTAGGCAKDSKLTEGAAAGAGIGALLGGGHGGAEGNASGSEGDRSADSRGVRYFGPAQ